MQAAWQESILFIYGAHWLLGAKFARCQNACLIVAQWTPSNRVQFCFATRGLSWPTHLLELWNVATTWLFVLIRAWTVQYCQVLFLFIVFISREDLHQQSWFWRIRFLGLFAYIGNDSRNLGLGVRASDRPHAWSQVEQVMWLPGTSSEVTWLVRKQTVCLLLCVQHLFHTVRYLEGLWAPLSFQQKFLLPRLFSLHRSCF